MKIKSAEDKFMHPGHAQPDMTRVHFVAIMIAVAAFVLTAGATSIVPLSIAQLTRESTHIVEAQALASHSQWDSEHKMIYTYTRFQVAKSIKGSAPKEIIVKQLGGRIDPIEQKAAGVQYSWPVGQRAVLFLRPSQANDGSFIITGFMQGDFRIYRDMAGTEFAGNGIGGTGRVGGQAGVQVYDPNGREIESYAGQRMTVKQLEAAVASSIARSSGKEAR